MKNKIIACVLTAVLFTALFPLNLTAAQSVPSYWLSENSDRYRSYQAENPGLSYDKIIAYVNVNVDKGYYNEVEQVSDPENILVICNKNFRLSPEYAPDDLISVSGSFKMRAEAARQYNKMKAAANDAGLRFIIYSAYRSYNSQRLLYNSYVARSGQASAERFSARAGHSEHQTGLAVDLLHKQGYSTLGSASFQKTDEYKWLVKHAHKYGFILRYPSGYEQITGYMYEPWHWRYIGVEAATTMYNENIVTYEEYFGKYLAVKQDEDNTQKETPAPVKPIVPRIPQRIRA